MTENRAQPRAELLAVALQLFATEGYNATSLTAIAEAAGYAKSSVLYHFDSKEALLQEALGPACLELEALLHRAVEVTQSGAPSHRFIEDFVDFLFGNTLQASIFLNQGQSLRGIPIIDEANGVLARLSNSMLQEALPTIEQRLRMALALGGAAYALVAGMNWLDDHQPDPEARDALVVLLKELLSPERFSPPAPLAPSVPGVVRP